MERRQHYDNYYTYHNLHTSTITMIMLRTAIVMAVEYMSAFDKEYPVNHSVHSFFPFGNSKSTIANLYAFKQKTDYFIAFS